VIVITNQTGIAKGRYTCNTLQTKHDYFEGVCISHGFRIDAFCSCPHHPNYSCCLCRKLGILMLEKAICCYRIVAAQNWIISDKKRDMVAARGAGALGLMVENNAPISEAEDRIQRECPWWRPSWSP
jgi:D-glycero-D-manno-heptose 1,7-bisphosphate phosphatase